MGELLVAALGADRFGRANGRCRGICAQAAIARADGLLEVFTHPGRITSEAITLEAVPGAVHVVA